MKKKLLRWVYIAFFFAFSIALFSVENEKDKEIIATEAESTENEVKSKERDSSSEKVIPEKKEAGDVRDEENIKKTEVATPSKKPTGAESAQGVQEGENPKDDIKTAATPQESTPKEQKKEAEVLQNADFASIQVTGLTIASGGEWYFEEYDEMGNIISKVSYNKNKMLSASTIQYHNGKRMSERITEGKKVINVKYNNKGEEIGREEFKSKKNGEEVAIASSNNIYADNGKIKEEIKTENGLTIRRVYTYDKDKKTSETVYENDVKTIFIEYKDDKKVVHIFDEGREVSVFTEEIEGGY